MATRKEVTCDRCQSITNSRISDFVDNSWKLIFANYEAESPEEYTFDLCKGCAAKVLKSIKEAMKYETQTLIEAKESSGMEGAKA